MTTRRIFHLTIGLFSFLLLLILFGAATGRSVSAQNPTATHTPKPPTATPITPTPATGPYFPPSQPLTPVVITPSSDPECVGGGVCMEVPVAFIEEILDKVLTLPVERADKTWEVEYNDSFPADTQVQLSLHRLLDSKGVLQMMDVSAIASDNTGSVDIQGLLPEQGPGGTFIGFACALESGCSTQNILDNLDSSDVQVWQFQLDPLITIDETDLSASLEPAPAIGFDFALESGLSRWDATFQWYKDKELLPTTDNPFYSLTNPFVLTGENRVELYQQRAFVLEKSNDWFGTQFNADALPPGVYSVDAYVNGIYEQTIEIPVGVAP